MKNRRILIISIIAILVAVAAIGTVFAILKGRSGTVKNDLVADSDLDPNVIETFENDVKSDVKVKVGKTDYSVYVRAAIVVNWQDDNGNVYWHAPLEDDYVLEINKTDWIKEGDFWYHKAPVESEGETAVLIERCYQTAVSARPQPEGYKLHVEILSQTVQAAGRTDDDKKSAVEDAWGITVGADGNLSPLPSVITEDLDPIVGPEFS